VGPCIALRYEEVKKEKQKSSQSFHSKDEPKRKGKKTKRKKNSG
jgi:hypothetical protein